jgi:hypothetical protein
MKFRPQTANHSSSLDAPGPGAYNPNYTATKSSPPRSKIGTGKRDGLYGDSAALPGPGHFNPSDSLFHD